MAYQIRCDEYVLHDLRDEELFVVAPKCKLGINRIGEASFTIYANHPYYSQMRKLRSIFEILQDGEPIFRGRMTEDTLDFDSTKVVDIEGVLGFFNDSVIRPFHFPEDFLYNSAYTTAAESGNVVEFFLNWLIKEHNEQTQPFQHFKLGRVTVVDKNNYITRSNSDYSSTWETLKEKLFESALGGYLCIRYEADGNYIDYLEDFDSVNTQRIEYGENLLDIATESDAVATYSAIVPLGKKQNEIDEESTNEARLTIRDLPDGKITDDIYKKYIYLYSKRAVDEFGFRVAPTSETTWDDVTQADNLQSNGVEYMTQKATLLSNTITIKALDLHFSDEDIEAFRIYKYVQLLSKPHNQEDSLKLTELDIDIENPQNTIITLGDIRLSLTDVNARSKQNASKQLDSAKTDIQKILGQTKTEIMDEIDEVVTSKVEQLADEITIEVTGSMGSKASIVLSVGDTQHKSELELSKVREAFANDKSNVTISGGLVTFNAGTLVINSNNFKVTSEGVIEATSGTVGGWTLKNYKLYAGDGTTVKVCAMQAPTSNNLYVFAAGGTSHDSYADCPFRVTKAGKLYATDAIINGSVVTIDSPYKTELDFGSLRLYWNDDLCGTVNTKYWSGAASAGISLRVEEGGKYIMFSHADDSQGSGYVVDYYLNAGWSSNYEEMHIFQTSARFLSDVYFAGYTRIRSLRLFDSDGEYLVGINSGKLTVSKL